MASSHSLPPHLVDAMRILFNIIDTNRNGFIHLDELKNKWINPQFRRSSTNIPVGFLDAVSKVAPSNQKLTFERFCAGLRLALAENNRERSKKYSNGLHRIASDGYLNESRDYSNHHNQSSLDKKQVTMGLAAKKLDNRRSIQQVFGSQPAINHNQSFASGNYKNQDAIERYRRPKQPSNWSNGGRLRRAIPPPPKPSATNDKLADESKPKRISAVPIHPIRNSHRLFRPISAISGSSSNTGTSTNSSGNVNGGSITNGNVRWRSGPKFNGLTDDGRRHTICEEQTPRMAKHERLLKEEEELIGRGMETTTKLLNWYNERMSSLEKRRQFLQKGMVALDTAVHEEKLNYLRAHITECNRRLVALMESSERSFPTHINLEIRNQMPQPNDDQLIWLRRQNRQLTEELTEKTQLMELLEREKRALNKQIQFQDDRLINNNSDSILIRHHFNANSYQRPSSTVSNKPFPSKVHATLM